jgi:uncharacterized protein YkwD
MQIFNTILSATFAAFVTISTSVCALPLEKRNQVSSNDIQEILLVHNKYRVRHGAPPLTWNDRLADYANKWSEKCIVNHSRVKYYI